MRTARARAFGETADEGLIELDVTAEPVVTDEAHGCAKLVQEVPGGFVAEVERPRQADGRHPGLGVCQLPGGSKPRSEWHMGALSSVPVVAENRRRHNPHQKAPSQPRRTLINPHRTHASP